jgi:hypothetical protein
VFSYLVRSPSNINEQHFERLSLVSSSICSFSASPFLVRSQSPVPFRFCPLVSLAEVSRPSFGLGRRIFSSKEGSNLLSVPFYASFLLPLRALLFSLQSDHSSIEVSEGFSFVSFPLPPIAPFGRVSASRNLFKFELLLWLRIRLCGTV